MKVDRWWVEPSFRDGLLVALDQVNEARSRRHGSNWELDSCRDCFGALNQLATGFEATRPGPLDRPRAASQSEAAKHSRLLTEMPRLATISLLRGPAVAALVNFEPLFLDHSSPGMTQRIEDLTDAVIAGASRAHEEFRDEWRRWEGTGSGAARTARKLVRAVLVVRNNIAHGEKTPSGPDLARRERNRAVARVVLPALEAIIDAVLDAPSHKLAAYGTLLPGKANEQVLSVEGTWSPITLIGRLSDESGLPAFSYALDGENIPAQLLISDQLPTLWESLDQLEGDRYARRLGLYKQSGVIGVANTYEWVGQQW